MRPMIGISGLVALVGAGLTNAVQAQSTDSAALEARIAALEAAERDRPKLSFGAGLATEVTIYGYVKADFIFDLDTDLGTTASGLGSIVPGGDTGDHFRAQAFQTRLGIRTVTPTSFGDVTARIEGDFFGNGGGSFRLRHADVNVGGFTFGQTWTNFMPIESYPSTLDFQGPAGIPFARVTQARYTHELGNGLGGSVSIEQSAGAGSDPALTAALTFTGDNYFVKLAGIGSRVDTPSGTIDAFGVNLSGNARLWEGGLINASYTKGEAIASYMVFGGADSFDSGGGHTAVESEGITIGIEQKFGDRWTFGVAYGSREDDIGAPTATHELETYHATAVYQVTENTTFGVEYITGERRLFDGSRANADRVQAAMQFNF